MITLTKEENTKRKAIQAILINKWHKIGMSLPHNWEDIVDECYEDICQHADPDYWVTQDVINAFGRWIESQAKYKNF